MNTTTIKTYVTKRGRDTIQEWIDDLPTRAHVAIDVRIRFLALGGNWRPPFAAKLRGYDSIWEIKVLSGNIQYRPLGCFGPGKHVFSILIGAIKKNNRFIPQNAPKTAEKRKQLIYQDEGYLNEYN